MDFMTFLIRILVCFVLGVAIGFERQWRRKAIGLRTNTLVCLGSFLFVAMSCIVKDSDTTRVAAQVVSGIGFLGAGVILRDGMNVRGLNTAATLWCSAAIGTLTAFGLLIEAIVGTVMILFSNIFLRFLSRKIMKLQKKQKYINYTMEFNCVKEREMIIKNLLMKRIESSNLVLRNIVMKEENEVIKIKVLVESDIDVTRSIEKLITKVASEPGISFATWKLDDNELDDDDNC